jgi:hypothetical protein
MFRGDVAHQRRLKEVAAEASPSDHDLRALRHRICDMLLDFRDGGAIDQWSSRHTGVNSVANL